MPDDQERQTAFDAEKAQEGLAILKWLLKFSVLIICLSIFMYFIEDEATLWNVSGGLISISIARWLLAQRGK